MTPLIQPIAWSARPTEPSARLLRPYDESNASGPVAGCAGPRRDAIAASRSWLSRPVGCRLITSRLCEVWREDAGEIASHTPSAAPPLAPAQARAPLDALTAESGVVVRGAAASDGASAHGAMASWQPPSAPAPGEARGEFGRVCFALRQLQSGETPLTPPAGGGSDGDPNAPPARAPPGTRAQLAAPPVRMPPPLPLPTPPPPPPKPMPTPAPPPLPSRAPPPPPPPPPPPTPTVAVDGPVRCSLRGERSERSERRCGGGVTKLAARPRAPGAGSGPSPPLGSVGGGAAKVTGDGRTTSVFDAVVGDAAAAAAA